MPEFEIRRSSNTIHNSNTLYNQALEQATANFMTLYTEPENLKMTLHTSQRLRPVPRFDTVEDADRWLEGC